MVCTLYAWLILKTFVNRVGYKASVARVSRRSSSSTRVHFDSSPSRADPWHRKPMSATICNDVPRLGAR